jgi:hypothetical protein
MRKAKKQQKAKFIPTEQEIPQFPDFDSEGRPMRYVIGWVFVPAYMCKHVQSNLQKGGQSKVATPSPSLTAEADKTAVFLLCLRLWGGRYDMLCTCVRV